MQDSTHRVPGKTLLAIVELGGYPNFASLYQAAGYQVVEQISMRKALSYLKHSGPAVIVAEFNFQPAFRDRTSNLESMLAVAQGLPETTVIVFYDPVYGDQLEKLRARFPNFKALPYPVDARRLQSYLR
jgi:hypothetical protein